MAAGENMVREELRQEAVEYVYGDLPADRKAAFESEMAGNPALKEEVAQLAALKERLSEVSEVQPPEHLVASVLADAEEFSRSRNIAKAPERSWVGLLQALLLRPQVGLGFVAVIVVALGIHVLREADRPAPPGSMERTKREFAAAPAKAPPPEPSALKAPARDERVSGNSGAEVTAASATAGAPVAAPDGGYAATPGKNADAALDADAAKLGLVSVGGGTSGAVKADAAKTTALDKDEGYRGRHKDTGAAAGPGAGDSLVVGGAGVGEGAGSGGAVVGGTGAGDAPGTGGIGGGGGKDRNRGLAVGGEIKVSKERAEKPAEPQPAAARPDADGTAEWGKQGARKQEEPASAPAGMAAPIVKVPSAADDKQELAPAPAAEEKNAEAPAPKMYEKSKKAAPAVPVRAEPPAVQEKVQAITALEKVQATTVPEKENGAPAMQTELAAAVEEGEQAIEDRKEERESMALAEEVATGVDGEKRDAPAPAEEDAAEDEKKEGATAGPTAPEAVMAQAQKGMADPCVDLWKSILSLQSAGRAGEALALLSSFASGECKGRRSAGEVSLKEGELRIAVGQKAKAREALKKAKAEPAFSDEAEELLDNLE